MTLNTDLVTRHHQIIKNAVAVLNGDLGEEALRCFLRFLNAQKRAEVRRANRSTLILAKLRDGSNVHFSQRLRPRVDGSEPTINAHRLLKLCIGSEVFGSKRPALPVAD
jgi:hypothetical protein